MNYKKVKIKFVIIFSTSLLLFSCANSSKLKQDFNCKESFFANLEIIEGVKDNFSVQFPKTWKTSLYTDEIQSSIYSADTIKNLTESILLDVSYVSKAIKINDIFKLKIEQDNLSNSLIQKEAKEVVFLNRPSYYVVSIGKKGEFNYKSLQIFTKIKEENSLIVKLEIYGDSLVNDRFCKGLTLIEKIKIH